MEISLSMANRRMKSEKLLLKTSNPRKKSSVNSKSYDHNPGAPLDHCFSVPKSLFVPTKKLPFCRALRSTLPVLRERVSCIVSVMCLSCRDAVLPFNHMPVLALICINFIRDSTRHTWF
jgi:hypothetical protein